MRETDVISTYHLLNHQHPLEIRVIKPATESKKSKVLANFMVKSQQEFTSAVEKWNRKANIYVGSRERRAGFSPTKKQSSTKRDITAITLIPVDIDAVRPGKEKQASTDKELKYTLLAAEYLRDHFFATRGFVPPTQAMSGNGVQLWLCLPRYLLPEDGWYRQGKRDFHRVEEATKFLYGELTAALPPNLSDKVIIDPIQDLTRLAKVIGTLSVKGEPEKYPDRPHRETYFIDEAVRREDPLLLEFLLDHQSDQKHRSGYKPAPRSAPTDHNEQPPELPPRFLLLLKSDSIIQKLWETEQADHSDHDWKLGSACIEAGINEAADLRTILMHNPRGKYRRDQREDYVDLTIGKLLALRYQKVWEHEGKYWTIKTIDKERKAVPITTFVMSVQRKIRRDGDLQREVCISNELGQTLDGVPLMATDMSTPKAFREFLYRQPISLKFSGTQADLTELMDLVQIQSSAPTITELPQVGRITVEGKTVWAFADVMICSGVAIKPDENGIFYLDGVGYRLNDLFGSGIPSLPEIGDNLPKETKNLHDLRRHTAALLHINLGFDGCTLIGWVGASLYAHLIRKRYDGFPLLFAVGSREAGKNVFGNWVTAFFKGIKPFGATSSTRVGFERAFEHYSHTPVWVEEYRNTKAVTSKDSVFRAAFDGVSDLKGKRGEGGIVRNPQACVLFTGEEVPNDNALLSRCAVVWLSKTKRNPDPDVFELLNDMSEHWSSLTRDLLIKQNPESEKAFLAEMQRVYRLLTTISSERQRRHFAIIAAGLRLFMEDTSEYVTWLLEEGKRQQELKEADSLLSEFITDLEAMHLQELIPSIYYTTQEGSLCLQLKPIYNLWEKYYRQRRGESPLGYRSLLGYLQEAPYYVDTERIYIRSRRSRCVRIDLEKTEGLFGFLV